MTGGAELDACVRKIYGFPDMSTALVAPTDVQTLSRFFRVLGDPTRLRIIELLDEGHRSVGELVALLDVSQPRVSAHLACLRHCRFVTAEPRGREMVYGLAMGGLRELLDGAREIAECEADHLASCRRIGPDWT